MYRIFLILSYCHSFLYVVILIRFKSYYNFIKRVVMINEVNRVLSELYNELHRPELFDARDIVKKMSSYLKYSGIEINIILMIQQCIHKYHYSPILIHYLRIIDKLIKIPSLSQILNRSITKIFILSFSYLYQQQNWKQLQELKFMRRYWKGSIYYQQLQKMRIMIFNHYQIDIDLQYQTSANSTYHAPSVGSPYFYNQHLTQYPFLEQRINNTALKSNSYKFTKDKVERRVQRGQSSQEINMSTDKIKDILVKPLEGQEFKASKKNKQIENKFRKQSTEETQETQTDSTQNDHIKSITNNEQKSIDYTLILHKLKNITNFTCKQCGLCFINLQNYEMHHQEHIRQKIEGLRIQKHLVRNKKKTYFCDLKFWKKQQLNNEIENDCIQIRQNELKQYHCCLCFQKFDLIFKNEIWVITKAVEIKYGSIRQIIHRTCKQLLQNQYESD